MANPGSMHTDFDVPGMIEREKSAQYGVRIYLKLQFQALAKAIEANNTEGTTGSLFMYYWHNTQKFPVLISMIGQILRHQTNMILIRSHGHKSATCSILYQGIPEISFSIENFYVVWK